MKLYHIDRSNQLKENKVIQLNKNFVNSDSEINNFFNSLFPSGISHHGEFYLNDYCTFPPSEICTYYLQHDINEIGIHATECYIELFRKAYYPHLPSRFTSLFALENIEDISLWPELTQSKYRIFEIEYTEKIYKFDASFIKAVVSQINGENNQTQISFCPITVLNEINKYLSGKLSDTPQPEILLPLPVTIGKEIYL
ncbi:DUF2441 domain-containing protein [Faecalicoccus pleomorphus]|uniref:DUF2441 domain-containing protein n=1 Tax=Faecalicoccus pleomorphus TaxID=1323 RepID=A0A3E3E476_9FIRM|nr:DUF2441 domain-containing protein [Faecalicoccus pleomorphus]RGD76380.1 DUF2441 domain-containing protein [Faecalicoccus pleomorphus]